MAFDHPILFFVVTMVAFFSGLPPYFAPVETAKADVDSVDLSKVGQGEVFDNILTIPESCSNIGGLYGDHYSIRVRHLLHFQTPAPHDRVKMSTNVTACVAFSPYWTSHSWYNVGCAKGQDVSHNRLYKVQTIHHWSSADHHQSCGAQEVWRRLHGACWLTEHLNQQTSANGFPPKLVFSKGYAQNSLSRPMVDFMLNDLNLTETVDRIEAGGYGIDELLVATLNGADGLMAPGGFTHACIDRNKPTKYLSRIAIWSDEEQLCGSRHFRHAICQTHYPLLANTTMALLDRKLYQALAIVRFQELKKNLAKTGCSSFSKAYKKKTVENFDCSDPF